MYINGRSRRRSTGVPCGLLLRASSTFTSSSRIRLVGLAQGCSITVLSRIPECVTVVFSLNGPFTTTSNLNLPPPLITDLSYSQQYHTSIDRSIYQLSSISPLYTPFESSPTMSVWNPDNIRDVAESVGIVNLNNDVTENLARDVEYRIAQVLEEALKFMRHGRRTLLTTQDIAHALRVLDVEPLYGYETTRPLRFGEASLGPGQPLFYVEDEEVDFEKLINAPLPKVPREIAFTGIFFFFLSFFLSPY